MILEILTLGMLAFCSYTDWKRKKIYRKPVFFFLGVLLLIHVREGTSWDQVLAGAIPGLGFLLFSFLSRQALGYGDAILILLCGMALGWERCVEMTVCAFFLAGLWGLRLWRFWRTDRKREFAFVPFLLAGMILQKIGSG